MSGAESLRCWRKRPASTGCSYLVKSDPNSALKPISDIINAEPVKNLPSPLTKEVGEFIGTAANLARFYATDNLEKMFTKWANVHRSGYTIEPEAFKKIMPLLPLASMVSDDELQDKWALLMESTATEDASLPSFGQTLFQLTARVPALLSLRCERSNGVGLGKNNTRRGSL